MPRFKRIHLTDGKECSAPDAAVVALGNFDGVHLGHQQLLKETVSLSRSLHASPAVFCFDIPSTDFLYPSMPPSHLSTVETKLKKFAEAGIEYAFLADFCSFRDLSAQDFIELLIAEFHARSTVCGFNFRFGKSGIGTPHDLHDHFHDSVTIPAFFMDGEIVSSTQIRSLISGGNIELANRFLGNPFSFSSVVAKGKQLGRTIGFPTINQSFPQGFLIPKFGVYQTLCRVGEKEYRGLSNVGTRPTVDRNAAVNCETYLLDYFGDLYGKTVAVSFLSYLRPEKQFSSIEELKAQIQKDIQSLK